MKFNQDKANVKTQEVEFQVFFSQYQQNITFVQQQIRKLKTYIFIFLGDDVKATV